MPSVRLENLPARQVIKRRRVICPRGIVGKPAHQHRAVELIAELLKDRDPPDENERKCFDLIRRFHRWGWRDTMHALRLLDVPVTDDAGHPVVNSDGQPCRRRYVLELAGFPSKSGPQWNVVTWEIDKEAMSSRRFPSERSAWHAFRAEGRS